MSFYKSHLIRLFKRYPQLTLISLGEGRFAPKINGVTVPRSLLLGWEKIPEEDRAWLIEMNFSAAEVQRIGIFCISLSGALGDGFIEFHRKDYTES